MGNQEPYAYFYPRSPCGERRWPRRNRRKRIYNFYPRSPCGERREVNKVLIVAPKFLSTLSLRRATGYVNTSQSWSVFLSTLSLRRATRQGQSGKALHRISIHALLAESDGEVNKVLIVAPKFLSTLSLRRATKNPNGSDLLCGDFYPRSPCGERPAAPGPGR